MAEQPPRRLTPTGPPPGRHRTGPATPDQKPGRVDMPVAVFVQWLTAAVTFGCGLSLLTAFCLSRYF